MHEAVDARGRGKVRGVRPIIQHAAHLLGDCIFAVLKSEKVGKEADGREGGDANHRERLDEREVERRDAVGAYYISMFFLTFKNCWLIFGKL